MRKYDHQQILALYDSGLALKDIAAQVGCSVANACVVAKRNGRSPFLRRYPQAERWDRDGIVSDYQAGKPLQEILRTHGVSPSMLHRMRQAAGVPLRDRPKLTGMRNAQYKHGMGSRGLDRKPWLTKQVAAICLGHVLPAHWLVHHMNEDPRDNRPENLAVFRTKSAHARYHQRLLRLQQKGLAVDASRVVSETGGMMLPKPDRPILLPQDTGRLDPPQRWPRQGPPRRGC